MLLFLTVSYKYRPYVGVSITTLKNFLKIPLLSINSHMFFKQIPSLRSFYMFPRKFSRLIDVWCIVYVKLPQNPHAMNFKHSYHVFFPFDTINVALNAVWYFVRLNREVTSRRWCKFDALPKEGRWYCLMHGTGNICPLSLKRMHELSKRQAEVLNYVW